MLDLHIEASGLSRTPSAHTFPWSCCTLAVPPEKGLHKLGTDDNAAKDWKGVIGKTYKPNQFWGDDCWVLFSFFPTLSRTFSYYHLSSPLLSYVSVGYLEWRETVPPAASSFLLLKWWWEPRTMFTTWTASRVNFAIKGKRVSWSPSIFQSQLGAGTELGGQWTQCFPIILWATI